MQSSIPDIIIADDPKDGFVPSKEAVEVAYNLITGADVRLFNGTKLKDQRLTPRERAEQRKGRRTWP